MASSRETGRTSRPKGKPRIGSGVLGLPFAANWKERDLARIKKITWVLGGPGSLLAGLLYPLGPMQKI